MSNISLRASGAGSVQGQGSKLSTGVERLEQARQIVLTKTVKERRTEYYVSNNSFSRSVQAAQRNVDDPKVKQILDYVVQYNHDGAIANLDAAITEARRRAGGERPQEVSVGAKFLLYLIS